MIVYPSYEWSKRMVHKSNKDLKRTVFKYCKYNPKVIFDVGANIGVYSFLFSMRYKDAKIYSFEPVVENFNYLVQNIEANNLKNVIPYNFGFYKEEKIMELGVPVYDKDDPRGGTYTLFSQGELTNKVVAKFKILDDFILQNNITEIDILKVDVEGSERNMFERGINALKITKMLHIEFWKQNKEHKDIMINFLEKLGFKSIRRNHQNFLFKKY
jgi:FkbM family methyltransferase